MARYGEMKHWSVTLQNWIGDTILGSVMLLLMWIAYLAFS